MTAVAELEPTPASALVRGKYLVGDEVEEFWRHVEIPDDPNACWRWTGGTVNGYPVHYLRKATVTAARVAWQDVGRPLSGSVKLRRTCHDPLCVRPDCREAKQGAIGGRGNKKPKTTKREQWPPLPRRPPAPAEARRLLAQARNEEREQAAPSVVRITEGANTAMVSGGALDGNAATIAPAAVVLPPLEVTVRREAIASDAAIEPRPMREPGRALMDPSRTAIFDKPGVHMLLIDNTGSQKSIYYPPDRECDGYGADWRDALDNARKKYEEKAARRKASGR